jgi:hypothetical protein
MNNTTSQTSKETQVVTLRIPLELKKRLEKHAKYQGVSLNHFASYLLNFEVTQLDAISSLENKLSKKELSSLKKKVIKILKKVPSRETKEWDSV